MLSTNTAVVNWADFDAVWTLMVQLGISVEDIRAELASRHIIDHKVKQEKMTK